MRTKSLILSTLLILLISVAFISIGCKKQEEAEQPEEATQVETSIAAQPEKGVIKPIEKKEVELKKGIDALLAEVEKKKQELIEKEKELAQWADSINVKKDELENWEGSLKTFRTISWIIIIVGAILFLIGLIFFLIARKKTAPQRAEKKTDKEQKKLTKAAEKAEKKTEKNLKKEEKPVAPKEEPKTKPESGK